VVIGAVAIDDTDAAGVVADLRNATAIRQAGELKFGQFAGGRGPGRVNVLAALLQPGGALVERSSVYMIDKRYFITAKIIDLLLEEYAHERGVDLYTDGRARHFAWTLMNEGQRALGVELFDELVRVFAKFARVRNRGQVDVDITEMFRALDLADRRSRRRAVSEILAILVRCHAQVADLQRRMLAPSFVEVMESLIPATATVFSGWSKRLGPTSMILGAHKVMTDERLDLVRNTIASGPAEFRFL
jgi:hypothetical protein